jgi:F-type H+-transporting ATPase subunit alpha
LNLAEQVAIVYAGVKGLIDEIAEEDVVKFARELREYLKTNRAEFINKVLSDKVLSEESEAMLKSAISEVTSSMIAAA